MCFLDLTKVFLVQVFRDLMYIQFNEIMCILLFLDIDIIKFYLAIFRFLIYC